MTLWKKVLVVVFVVLAALVIFVIKTFRDAGEFKTLVAHFDGRCRAVMAVGPEDIAVDPDLKVAMVSSDDRRAAQRGAPVRGAIYAYELETPNAPLKNLTPRLTFDFHPHGISLYRSRAGKRLFVVNHRREGNFIEIFALDAAGLRHLESISGPLLTSPNDLAAAGPREFYVTNDHGAASPMGKTIEEYLQRAIAYVLYYDGRQFRKVADKIAYANGIALSNDGSLLYVASPTGKLIRVFDRSGKDGTVRFREDITLGTGVDNIEVDGEGSIWAGCHPKLLTFVKHSKDPGAIAPSQVLRIAPVPAGGYNITEVYLNDGREMSASTVGIPYRNRLLIGCVFDDRFLDCTAGK